MKFQKKKLLRLWLLRLRVIVVIFSGESVDPLKDLIAVDKSQATAEGARQACNAMAPSVELVGADVLNRTLFMTYSGLWVDLSRMRTDIDPYLSRGCFVKTSRGFLEIKIKNSFLVLTYIAFVFLYRTDSKPLFLQNHYKKLIYFASKNLCVCSVF